ncbi:MAG: efflux RND transporter periplasmic adaptor subunit [Lentimicrobiaceae bacterium]|nr:efflux RND transporter periplasmic adaptor subunit [Lentimicrobiaceae bacterium]
MASNAQRHREKSFKNRILRHFKLRELFKSLNPQRIKEIKLSDIKQFAENTRITRKQWIWICSSVVVVVAGILCWVFRPREVPVEYPVVAVETVTTEDVSIYGEYVGRIRAQQFVEIRARVEGYLEKMLFDEGKYVERGQTLFIIDPKLYQARVANAKARLNKARAQALKAERDLNRIRPLFERNAASQLDLDNAIATYESAAADVVVSETDLMQAELTLSYTTVRSPISGYISERNIDIGTLVGPGGQSLLATVVKSDSVRVDFSMTALDYLRSKSRNVNIGHKDSTRKWDPYITITLADGSEYPYRGLVDFADPQVDPTTGTFSVRAEMPNPHHELLPGQFTRVKMLLDVRENAVVAPSRALEIEKGGAYIFVVRPDNIVEKRFVEIGPELENRTVIERGLVRGEQIVVDGYHKLSHGIQVQPVKSTRKK